MQYQDLIQRVQKIGPLTETEIMTDRGFKIHFNEQKIIIYCELEPNNETLAIYSEISKLPEYETEAYLKNILEAHLCGRATGLAYFGYDEQAQSIYLFRNLTLRHYEPEEVKSAIQELFIAIQFWRETLKDIPATYSKTQNKTYTDIDTDYFSQRI